jgi:hypothetical protein
MIQNTRRALLYGGWLMTWATSNHRDPAQDGQSAGEPGAGVGPIRGAALEVVDIFRTHGSDWRVTQRSRLSLDQLKVIQ